jgi:MoaA/NifB/PqqE/SkfB family radical SAM enzyme
MPDLTVFLVSCNDGNPNYPACHAALERQEPAGAKLRIEYVHNKAPMDRAFQAMIDQCETSFFIQCDQDMILRPDAAARMLADIRSQPPDVAFVVYMLNDIHTGIPIQGVKIYRHAVVKQFPYVEGISCERSQLDRIKDGGFRFVERWDVLGDHSPKWTNELIFERYFDLMEKWKKFGYGWLENMPAKLMAKYVETQHTWNLYAFLGAWASASRPEVLRTREKDFRVRTPEYAIARGWFSQPTQATLYMTDKCNLKCGWCLRQGTMASVPPAIPMDATIVDELIARFPSIGSFCLCGFGETLLHPNIGSVIDRCRGHGCWCGLITNGVYLRDALPTLLAHRPTSISISLNASSQEEHAAETGVAGAWDLVLDGIAAIREHRATLASLHCADRGIPLYLSRVCTAQNIDLIPEFLALAKELGVVDGVDLHNVLPHNVGTPEDEKAFLDTVLTYKHRTILDGMKGVVGAELVRNWPIVIDPDTPVRRCDYPFCSIAVDGNRNFSVCNSIMPPTAANGTIRNARVWQSSYAQDLRLSFSGDELPAWCRYCFRQWS